MYQRYAIYYTPPPGPLATFGAQWLGWDSLTGRSVPQLDLPGFDLPSLTETPRRYGFHATIKPPFALAPGCTETALAEAFTTLCRDLPAVALDGLVLTRLGRFLALTAAGDPALLKALAARVVRDLDSFRAPPDTAEIEHRARPHLTAAQRDNLARWGYPHVMESFRFHITLTGRTDKDTCARLETALPALLAPFIRQPPPIATLSLMGEAPDGCFHEITRASLTGQP